MPVGIIINSLSILFGGVLGLLMKKVIPSNLKQTAPLLFGFSAMAIGIKAIVSMDRLHIVIISIIVGGFVGEWLNLDSRLNKMLCRLLKSKNGDHGPGNERADNETLILIITLFCFSSTGIFGAITEGLTGDSQILLAKSVLDFFTAMIFATSLGFVVSLIFLPQLMILLLLFFLSSYIQPVLTTGAIQNFIACGGIITLMIGFSLTKLRDLKAINLIPALILVIVFSQFVH